VNENTRLRGDTLSYYPVSHYMYIILFFHLQNLTLFTATRGILFLISIRYAELTRFLLRLLFEKIFQWITMDRTGHTDEDVPSLMRISNLIAFLLLSLVLQLLATSWYVMKVERYYLFLVIANASGTLIRPTVQGLKKEFMTRTYILRHKSTASSIYIYDNNHLIGTS
jgi:hypothetical protein